MSQVRLTIEEAERQLPPVCMVCGANAPELIYKKLSWTPSWVWVLLLFGLLPVIIVALITTKRAVLLAPLCPAHRSHWTKRTAWVVLSFCACIVLVILAIAAEGRPWQGAAVAAAILLFVVWIIAAIVASSTAIRALSISATEILLTNVSPLFVDALVEADTDWPDMPEGGHAPLRARQADFRFRDSRRESPDDRFEE